MVNLFFCKIFRAEKPKPFEIKTRIYFNFIVKVQIEVYEAVFVAELSISSSNGFSSKAVFLHSF